MYPLDGGLRRVDTELISSVENVDGCGAADWVPVGPSRFRAVDKESSGLGPVGDQGSRQRQVRRSPRGGPSFRQRSKAPLPRPTSSCATAASPYRSMESESSRPGMCRTLRRGQTPAGRSAESGGVRAFRADIRSRHPLRSDSIRAGRPIPTQRSRTGRCARSEFVQGEAGVFIVVARPRCHRQEAARRTLRRGRALARVW